MGVSEFMAIVRFIVACILGVWAFRAIQKRDTAAATVAIVMWHAVVTHP